MHSPKNTDTTPFTRGPTGSFGALVHGPTGHWFYGMLDSKMPGTAPMTVVSKVAIDQVCFPENRPLFAISRSDRCVVFEIYGVAVGILWHISSKPLKWRMKRVVLKRTWF